MTPTPGNQPSLKELTARFLSAKASPQAIEVEDVGDVVPHEVAGGFQAPAALTWSEALAVFGLCGIAPEKFAAPPEWAAFAALETGAVAVPLAAGLFPQRFRQVPGTLTAGNLSQHSRGIPTQSGFSSLRNWIKKALDSKSPTKLLVASGVAAVLGDLDEADAALTLAEGLCSGSWRAVWENQRAAIHSLAGRTDEASKVWGTAENPAAQFNRGLSDLAAGRSLEAADTLQSVAGKLPVSSGWSHLAMLYAAVAKAG